MLDDPKNKELCARIVTGLLYWLDRGAIALGSSGMRPMTIELLEKGRRTYMEIKREAEHERGVRAVVAQRHGDAVLRRGRLRGCVRQRAQAAGAWNSGGDRGRRDGGSWAAGGERPTGCATGMYGRARRW